MICKPKSFVQPTLTRVYPPPNNTDNYEYHQAGDTRLKYARGL